MRASACQRTSEPAVCPVTIGQMRAHLRLSGHEEDSLVSAAISAATNALEEQTRRAFITQTWRASITESWGEDDPIMLPRPRLLSITSVQYWRDDDTWATAASTTYRTQSDTEPATLWLTETASSLGDMDHDDHALWRVTYTAGYGQSPNDVPDSLRAAIKLFAAHLFEAREPVNVGNIVTEIPLGIDRLIAPYRVPWGGTNL